EDSLSGSLRRWLPWLSERMPERFIAIGTALAREKGMAKRDHVLVSTPRARIRARALVTNRIGVMQVAGRTIHHVGMPWHWGWMGLARGDDVDELTCVNGDASGVVHRGKALVCLRA